MKRGLLIFQLQLIGYTPFLIEEDLKYLISVNTHSHLIHRYVHPTLPYVNIGLWDRNRFRCLKPGIMAVHMYIEGGIMKNFSKIDTISELPL